MPSKQKLMEIIRMQTDIAKQGFDLCYVMQSVVEQTLTLVHADGAAIEMTEGEDMVYRAASGIAQNMLGLRLKIDKSLSGLSVRENTIQVCKDTELDERVDKEACRRIGVRSMMIMPLEFNDKSVGVLKAMYKDSNGFGDKDIVLLSILAEMIGASLYYSEQYNNDALFKKATHDSMTGLVNKVLFMDRLQSALEHSKRSEHEAAVVIGDMDNLKLINDTIGHRAGDAALIEVANRIKETIRETDTAARIGGDEFGFILFPLSAESALPSAIERIETALEAPFEFEDKTIELKLSLGGAAMPTEGEKVEELYDLADKRMYKRKRFNKRGLDRRR